MKTKRIPIEIAILAVLVPLASIVPLAGCSSDSNNSAHSETTGAAEKITQFTGQYPIRVVCTTNIVKDIVKQVGGAHVAVAAIMDGPGIDPHTYTASPQDMNALTGADLVVYSGLHLEGQLYETLESLRNREIPVICLTYELEHSADERLRTDESGAVDPHVWFHPELWADCGRWLGRQLGELDPSHTDDYQNAAQEYAASMSRLLKEGRATLAQIPRERRVLVTAHDAFEYFAAAFDVSVEAVQGISTDSEPGLRRINELTDLLVRKKITAVFTEQSVSDRNIQALIAGCSQKGHTLIIGGRLYSDTAGAEGTPEETLAGALQHNLKQISAAWVGSEEPQP